LTRAITIIALICFLVVGATTASILGRDSVPAAGPELAAASAAIQRPIVNRGAVPNREGKSDRLTIAAVAPPSFEPPPTAAIPSEPLRQAFAATPSADIEGLRITDPAPSAAAPKPKLVNKPPAQKSYALLSDAQIAGIKERLKLSSYQESYWPAVETALRAVARKIQAARQADPTATGVPIDPDAEEVQQLKSAAMPLLFQLREDQKREVRTLARLIGLEKVAAQI
jgi:hypothetical protein